MHAPITALHRGCRHCRRRTCPTYFIEQLQIALPVLGVNVLRVAAAEPPAPTTPRDDVRSPIFELAIPKRGIRARAQHIDGEFTVLAGSVVAGSVSENEKYPPTTAAA